MAVLRGVLKLLCRGINARHGRRIHLLHSPERSLLEAIFCHSRRHVIFDDLLQPLKVNLLFNVQPVLASSSDLELRGLHTNVPSAQIPQLEGDVSDSQTASPSEAPEGTQASPPAAGDEDTSPKDDSSESKPASDATEQPVAASKNAITPILPGMPTIRRGGQVAPVGVILSSQGLIREMTERINKGLFQDAIQIYRDWLQCPDPTTGLLNRPSITPCNMALLAEAFKGAPVDILLKRVDEIRRLGLNPNTDTFYVLFNAAAEGNYSGVFDRLFSIVQELGIPVQAEWCIKAIGMRADTDVIKAMDYVKIMVANNLSPDKLIISRLVSAFSRLNQALKATDIVRWGQKKDVLPSLMALGDLLQSCIETDISEGALLALEIMYGRRKGRPALNPTFDEGTLLAVLSMAARTGDLALSTKTWEVLLHSLKQFQPPSPSSFLARLHASVTGGDLDLAISTLQAMETTYGSEMNTEVFSPFSSLRPFVLGCARGGSATLDAVYFKLEGMLAREPVPLSAINCIILGCSNTWDIDRAYQTFEAIRSVFGLMPNVHSCNALIDGFGKMRKISETLKVHEYMTQSGIQPDQRTYSLLIKAHIVNRDTTSAFNVVNQMCDAGFSLEKDIALKIRRRCLRESDEKGARQVLQFSRKFNYSAGFTGDARRSFLFTGDARRSFPFQST